MVDTPAPICAAALDAAATLVDLMAHQVDDGPTSVAWNALRIALLPHRVAIEAYRLIGHDKG